MIWISHLTSLHGLRSSSVPSRDNKPRRREQRQSSYHERQPTAKARCDVPLEPPSPRMPSYCNRVLTLTYFGRIGSLRAEGNHAEGSTVVLRPEVVGDRLVRTAIRLPCCWSFHYFAKVGACTSREHYRKAMGEVRMWVALSVLNDHLDAWL